jgi:thioredoxin 1
MVTVVSGKDFEKEVKKSAGPVIIDFFADWCGPCLMMAPVFEELSIEYKGRLRFVKMDTDEASDVAAEFEVSSIPCLMMVNKGKEIEKIVGFMPKQLLKQKIDEALARLK